MRQRGEMRVPLPGCIAVALDGMQWDGRDGTGWNGMGWLWAGCGVMVSTGAKAPAFFRCSPSCPALKRSQQEGRGLGKLYLSPASSEGLGSTGRSILGWYCQEAQSSVGPAVAAILLTQGLPPGRCLSQPTGSSGDDASALWQRGNAQASRCIRRPGSDTLGKAPRDTSVPSVPGSESPRVRAWHPGHPPRSPVLSGVKERAGGAREGSPMCRWDGRDPPCVSSEEHKSRPGGLWGQLIPYSHGMGQLDRLQGSV